MAEKYSVSSSIRREKMRIISGITALNLIGERRFEEAAIYSRPLVEIKDSSVDDIAQFLPPGFVPSENRKIAEDEIGVGKLLSHDPASIEEIEINESRKKLVELLHVLGRKTRV